MLDDFKLVPKKWQVHLIDEIAIRGSGHTPDRKIPEYWNGGIKWVSLADSDKLDRKFINSTTHEISQTGIENSSAEIHPPDSVLISRDAGVGKSAVMACEMAVSQHFIVWRCGSKLVPLFLYYTLQSQKAFFERIAVGSTIKTIGLGIFRRLKMLVPPLHEQQKIADILATWDEALEKLDALIIAEGRRKQALMQQIITGHCRLPGFRKPWRRVELSEVAEECSIRNGLKLDRTRLYAVTKAEGMVPMRENVQGATINRCQIVERGWFAYNPMRINIGSIARWENDEPVMVSPDYVVFRTKESLLLSDYLNHIRRAVIWSDFVGAAGNGSVRIRIWFDDLGYFKFPLPPIE